MRCTYGQRGPPGSGRGKTLDAGVAGVLLLLPVNNTTILKQPGLQQLQELDDEELVLVVLECQVRVLGEAGPLVLFVEGAYCEFELLPN